MATAIRLAIGALTPLFPDETYYWDWSRRLAGGYFDHPPAIAWLIRAGTMLAGDTPLGVRLFPILAGTVAGCSVAAAARRLGGDRAAVLASLVFAVMPLASAGLVLATPDAPLFAASAACLHAVLRALEYAAGDRRALAWWSVAGACLGVAVASKYTAVLLPAGVLLGILHRAALRRHAWSPGPWVATLLAALVFSPVILWNARHDWASFAFQLGHGLGAAGGSVLARELDLLGGQAGLVTPILFVMMVVAAARGTEPRKAMLRVTAFVIFVFFMYSATRRRAEANWPALAYIPGMLLLATHAGGAAWRRWLRWGIGLAALVTAVTYVNTLIPILPLPARRDPVARSSGWRDLAMAVERERSAPRDSGRRIWVAGDRYQEASELAFHLPGRPETFSLNLASRANQYDLWPSFGQRAAAGDGLAYVVDEVADAHPALGLLRPHFASVRKGAMVTLARNGDPVKYLRVWVLEGWRGTWPRAPLRSRP